MNGVCDGGATELKELAALGVARIGFGSTIFRRTFSQLAQSLTALHCESSA